MEEHINPLALPHFLQQTLRSLCIHENSQWVYAVFWRILPRNYPPPKWEGQGAYDRSRGNRRNWILVWEDGFCNFSGSPSTAGINGGEFPSSSSDFSGIDHHGLQPEIFFKLSHEIYSYGEGLVGKVALDHSHKWIIKEPNDREINYLSPWHDSTDSHPRTWEAQFQSGIKTIALIAVREGVVQLGSLHKVIEDLNYVVLLRKKFSYIESIPGVLLPHPSSSSLCPFKLDEYGRITTPEYLWNFQAIPTDQFHDHFHHQLRISPSMSSLEALLSRLPSVVPTPLFQVSLPGSDRFSPPEGLPHGHRHLEFMAMVQKGGEEEIIDNQEIHRADSSMNDYHHDGVGESSSSTFRNHYSNQQYFLGRLDKDL